MNGEELDAGGLLQEVADLALFLASDARSGNVTGSDFRVDGGYIPTW